MKIVVIKGPLFKQVQQNALRHLSKVILKKMNDKEVKQCKTSSE